MPIIIHLIGQILENKPAAEEGTFCTNSELLILNIGTNVLVFALELAGYEWRCEHQQILRWGHGCRACSAGSWSSSADDMMDSRFIYVCIRVSSVTKSKDYEENILKFFA